MVKTLRRASWLEGKRVAVAGRLASMTRSEAAHLIAAHGGIYARTVTRAPTIVVVGRDGWPLAADGRPTRKLRKALALAKQGYDVEILPEEDLLARLHCPTGRLQRHFTLRELTHVLGVPAPRLNVWLRARLIDPAATVDGIRYFDFRHVAGAKSLCELVRSGVTIARLRQSLRRLRKWLGDIEDPLSQLTTLEHSRKLVVRLADGQLAEPGGQLLFEFAGQPPDAIPPSLPWVAQARNAEEWFELGCRAEDRGDLLQAATAYRQALLAGGPSAESCFNLANVLSSLGQYAQAGERYRQVLEIDPNFWEAWNNLGTVLTYEGHDEEAIEAYRHALRLHPRYCDAHYNLADTLEDLGRRLEARDHWRAYLQIEPRGPGAEYARERLRQLDR
ncbi:MAG: tetratricopeptide repeat protein [Pirellulales bacterium]